MTLSVFLDTNVLVPISLTNVILRMGDVGLLDPHWSNTVLDETRRVLVRLHPEMGSDVITRRFAAMNRAFPDALVDINQRTVESLTLPDPDDRHVLAGAIKTKSTVILTSNIKDFPASMLDRHGLRATTPDALLLDQLTTNSSCMMDVLTRLAAESTNPPLTITHILTSLARAGAPRLAQAVLERINESPIQS